MVKKPKPRRPLNEQERKFCELGLKAIEEEEKYLDYRIRKTKLLLEKGIDWEAKKELENLNKLLEEAKKNNDEYQIENITLYLNEGLNYEIEKKKLGLQAQLIQYDRQLKDCARRRESAQDQIKNGVETRR